MNYICIFSSTFGVRMVIGTRGMVRPTPFPPFLGGSRQDENEEPVPGKRKRQKEGKMCDK